MRKLLLAFIFLSSSLSMALEEQGKVVTSSPKILKVEDHSYHHYKCWNIGVNAFIIPAGVVSLSASYAFVHNVAARLGVSFESNTRETKNENYQWQKYNSVFLGIPVYISKVYNGPFLEPGISSRNGVYVSGGYHWMWDTGINFMAGVNFSNKNTVGILQVAYAF